MRGPLHEEEGMVSHQPAMPACNMGNAPQINKLTFGSNKEKTNTN